MNNILKQNTLNAIFFKLQFDLLNSDNLRIAITQLCHELQFWNFIMLWLIQMYMNKIFIQNSLYTIIFKFQLIY